MNTKYKHKKLAVFLLFVTTYILLRIGMILAFFTRFFSDEHAMAFRKMYPGAPFPPDLKMELAFFQSYWYIVGLSLLLVLPLANFIAKRLQFTKPQEASLITVLSLCILFLMAHYFSS